MACRRTLHFVRSPIAAWVMSGVSWLGYWPWLTLHFAALLLVGSKSLILLMLCSWGFWFDFSQGNTLTFVLVAGILGLRGQRSGSLASVALLVLMPRPLQVPLIVWLLCTQPNIRLPSAAIAVVHGVLVLATGQLGQWVEAMASYNFVSEIGYTLDRPNSWVWPG